MSKIPFRAAWACGAVAALILIASCRTAEQHTEYTEITWRTLEAGQEEARETRKPLLIDFFFGEGCKRCAELEAGVYSDPLVSNKVSRYFVPVRVDLTKELTPAEQKIADRHKSAGECMLLFLDPDGHPLSDREGVSLCFMGMVTRDQFLSYLDDVIDVVRSN